jgi:hypothetical protein
VSGTALASYVDLDSIHIGHRMIIKGTELVDIHTSTGPMRTTSFVRRVKGGIRTCC